MLLHLLVCCNVCGERRRRQRLHNSTSLIVIYGSGPKLADQLIEFINAYLVRSQSAPLPPISRLTQFGEAAAAQLLHWHHRQPALEYALMARSGSADVYGKQCR